MTKLKSLLLLFAVVVYSLPNMAQTATLNTDKKYQYIRGFGGINHPTWCGDLTEAQCNTAFGNGDGQLGFSILRIWVDSDSQNWSKEIATAKRAANHGAIIFATPWNPPTDMTETVSRNGRNEKRLKYASYQAYTDHLVDFNNYMYKNGVNLHAMSFANEPDYGYDWTWYSADEVYNYTKNYADQLRVNGTKVISAESFAYNKSYYDKILNDASALKNIDIIGTHFYASDANTANTFFQYALADQKAPNHERWMTEHYTSSTASANGVERANAWPEALDVSYEIHRAMVEGGFSAYVWWYIRRFYGPILDDGSVSKRGWCMAQFSKFIRPGFVRVDIDKNPTYNVYTSAYKNDNGDVVIVAVNRSTEAKNMTFDVSSANDIATWERYVTSGTKNLQKETDIASEAGSFQITLDAQSTTTFVGKSEETIDTVPQMPYSGITQTIPGTIEAENYDLGGEGVSYHDEEKENKGDTYREDWVDIDGNETDGYAVGWTIRGEWLEYTIDVKETAKYRFEARVASGADNSSFRLYIDGNAVTDTIFVENSDGWGFSNQTIAKGITEELTEGEHILKLEITGSYCNIDKITFSEFSGTGLTELSADKAEKEYEIYSASGIFLGRIKTNRLAIENDVKQIAKKTGVYFARSDGENLRILVR